MRKFGAKSNIDGFCVIFGIFFIGVRGLGEDYGADVVVWVPEQIIWGKFIQYEVLWEMELTLWINNALPSLKLIIDCRQIWLARVRQCYRPMLLVYFVEDSLQASTWHSFFTGFNLSRFVEFNHWKFAFGIAVVDKVLVEIAWFYFLFSFIFQ